MGADLFESYVGSIIAAATLGLEIHGQRGVALPFYIAGGGIFCAIIGTLFVRTQKARAKAVIDGDAQRSDFRGHGVLIFLGS